VDEDPQEMFQEVSQTEESLYPLEVPVEADLEDEENTNSGQIFNGVTEDEVEEGFDVHDDIDIDQDQGSYGDDLKDDEEEYESDLEDEEYNSPEPEPPAKRSRPSSEPEVVLDSDDNEDVTPQPPSLPPQVQARPGMFAYNQQQQHYMSPQQAMIMAQQRAQQAAYFNLQQQLQLQHGQGRKRKREGVALCIRDSQVYIKPFAHLPSFLVNNNPKPQPQPQPGLPKVPEVQQSFMLLQQQQPPNPYKPISQSPYQPNPAMSFPPGYHQPHTRTDRDSVEDMQDSDEDILDDASRGEEEEEEDFNSDDDIQSCNEEDQLEDNTPLENVTEEPNIFNIPEDVGSDDIESRHQLEEEEESGEAEAGPEVTAGTEESQEVDC